MTSRWPFQVGSCIRTNAAVPADRGGGDEVRVIAAPASARSELLFGVVALLSPALVWWGPASELARLRWLTDTVAGGVLYSLMVIPTAVLLLLHAIRVLRGAPLVATNGAQLMILGVRGYRQFARPDVAGVRVVRTGVGDLSVLAVVDSRGRVWRVGHQPLGSSWEDVVAELQHWMRGETSG